RSIFTATFILLLAGTTLAQEKKLVDFNQERLKINKIGMITLGGWALGNIAINGLLARNASGSTKYFYQGNIYWNLVNLGLAGVSYYASVNTDPASLNLAESIKEYYSIQKILLFNAGLDVAYITGGFFLKERAKNTENRREMFTGFGNALILQGGFLLAFDLVMFLVHHSNAGFLQNLSLSKNGIGMVFTF
ncbi:MAG: DUF6992 family protein, partial [Cyclobacteriaceae bacterium]